MNDLAALWAVYALLYLFNHVRLVPMDWVGVVVSPLRRKRRYRLILPRHPFRFGGRQLIVLAPLRPDQVVFNARLPNASEPAARDEMADFPALVPLIVLQGAASLALLVAVPVLSIVSLERALLAFVVWHLLFWVTALFETRRAFSGRWKLPCFGCAAFETLFNLASTPCIGLAITGRIKPSAIPLVGLMGRLADADRRRFDEDLAERLADMEELGELSPSDAAALKLRLDPRS